MSKQVSRAELVDGVAEAAAAFGAAADAVDAAVADRLGVNRTDLTIIGAVHAAGRVTAGEAAEAARLSPAATSTAIQRLVGAGLLRRGDDPDDRRRASLRLTEHCAREVESAYGPIATAGRLELERWSDAELATIERFLRAGVRFQVAHAARIRDDVPPPPLPLPPGAAGGRKRGREGRAAPVT